MENNARTKDGSPSGRTTANRSNDRAGRPHEAENTLAGRLGGLLEIRRGKILPVHSVISDCYTAVTTVGIRYTDVITRMHAHICIERERYNLKSAREEPRFFFLIDNILLFSILFPLNVFNRAFFSYSKVPINLYVKKKHTSSE